jgi:hypothetical protein
MSERRSNTQIETKSGAATIKLTGIFFVGRRWSR